MGTATAARRARRRLPLGLTLPLAAAALIALAYLAFGPRTADLAAHVYRAGLFGRAGLTPWDGGWYGGHHTPAYSLLFPPLAWALGPTVVGALAVVAASLLFVPLARTRLAAVWFAIGAAAWLFTGRMPFLLGVAIGLASLLALARGRRTPALLLAAATSLVSPVAGAFLALAALATRTRTGVAAAACALAPVLLLAIAFPEGGYEPFAFSSYVAIPVFTLIALALLDRSERTLRLGVVLYGLAGTAAYAIHTPMGGNAARLGALFAGPALAGARLRGPRALALVVFAALAYWQLQPPIRDAKTAYADRSTRSAYYAPLLSELARRAAPGAPARVEIPFTRDHWEAAEVAPHVPLARGWERQLDIARNPIFYDGRIDAASYRAWLGENAVRWVALPDARLDYSSLRERTLIAAGQPFLRPLWRSRHWRLYEVVPAAPLAVGALATRLSNAAVELAFASARPALVRVAWSPYWRAAGACVERAGSWTRVSPRHAGTVRMTIDFSLDRVVDHGQRCG